jgi:hypothetical protein
MAIAYQLGFLKAFVPGLAAGHAHRPRPAGERSHVTTAVTDPTEINQILRSIDIYSGWYGIYIG